MTEQIIKNNRIINIYGDYPYYRDNIKNWSVKIAKIKEFGVNVITCYIPWRHHLIKNGVFDFDGTNGLPERNVNFFLNQVADAGLSAIVRPGPFIHAEVELGGLPDQMSPSFSSSMQSIIGINSYQRACSEGKLLPFPFDKTFLANTSIWIEEVMKNVISRQTNPKGPIIAIQIGNEGIFSDTNWPDEKANFESFYLNINSNNNEKCLGYEVYQEFVDHFSKIIRLYHDNLPIIFSVASPGIDIPISTWIRRVRPEKWAHQANYAYTDWNGNAMKNHFAIRSLLIAAKRFNGGNIEENSGFTWHDKTYSDPHTFIFHAALHLAAGSLTYSYYPVVTTNSWGKTIAVNKDFYNQNPNSRRPYDSPYGEVAPVGVLGEENSSFQHLKKFNEFIWTNYASGSYEPQSDCLIIWPKNSFEDQFSFAVMCNRFENIIDQAIKNGDDFYIDWDQSLTDEKKNRYREIIQLDEINKLDFTIPIKHDAKILDSDRRHLFFSHRDSDARTLCCFIFNLEDHEIDIRKKIVNIDFLIKISGKSVLIFFLSEDSKKIITSYLSAPKEIQKTSRILINSEKQNHST